MTTSSRIRKSIDRLTAAELADYEQAFAKLKEISEADPSDIDGLQYFRTQQVRPVPGGGPAPVRPAAHRQGDAAVLGLVGAAERQPLPQLESLLTTDYLLNAPWVGGPERCPTPSSLELE
jgi:hypothetical protein